MDSTQIDEQMRWATDQAVYALYVLVEEQHEMSSVRAQALFARCRVHCDIPILVYDLAFTHHDRSDAGRRRRRCRRGLFLFFFSFQISYRSAGALTGSRRDETAQYTPGVGRRHERR